MLVRHFRSLSFTLLLIAAAAGAVVATSAWTMELKTGGVLRLAIVDARKPSPARDAGHQVLVVRLAAAVTQRAARPLEIAAQDAAPGEARVRLRAGDCDAVLVLADDRPSALRRFDGVTLCGELDPEAGQRPVYLLVSKDDIAMRELLGAAFASVLADRATLSSIEIAERDAKPANMATN